MSDALNAWEQAFEIADGRERSEVISRARNAFDFANDVRADSTDRARRVRVINAALGWQRILIYMDSTGAGVVSIHGV